MVREQQIVAIYCRLSKEDLDKTNKGDDSESIQNQKLLLIDHAVQNGFLIYNIYVDEDLSGFSDRPAFKQMIKDAQEGLFNIIMCKSQSRFTRDMEIVERYIHGYFMEWGIRFISVTDNVDTNIQGNKKARQIYGLINEWYSEDLSENIRAVFKKKMEAGQYLGSFACFGYEKDPINRHKLIVDEVAAKTIRKIFSLYLEGFGLSRIAIILSELGIPTPTQHKKEKGLNFYNPNGGYYSQKYGVWSASTVKRILKNEIYIGTLIQGREKKVSYKSKKVVIVPEDQWVVIKNNHEPIIEESVFQKVQKVINGNRRKYGNNESSKTNRPKSHIMAGKMVCADCRGIMQRSGISRDGRTYYIRCRLSAKTKRRECTPHCIAQEKIEIAIKDKLQKLINSALEGDGQEEVINKALVKIKSEKNLRPKLEKQLSEVKGIITSMEKNIAMTYVDKLNGNINETDFITFRKIFEDEKLTQLQKKAYLKNQLLEYDFRQKSISSILITLEKYKNINILSHELINDFVDVVLIGEKNPLTKEQDITIKWLI